MRLIDADKVLSKIRNPYERAEVARWLDAVPTIEPEQKTGKWILDGKTEIESEMAYHCSECGCGEVHRSDTIVSFCWNCGAKMEGQDGH